MIKSVRRIGFVAIALTFMLGAFAAGEAKAQAINIIYDKMDAHNKALTSLQADLAMATYNAQIGENDPLKTGKVWYVPKKGKTDMYIRMDLVKPAKEILVIYNGRYRSYRERLNQGYEGTVDKARSNASASGPLAFLSMSRKDLRENYDARVIGTEKVAAGTIVTTRLELTPKDKTKYKQAELWVDVDGMPVQAKVVSANGDTTTVLLTNALKNQLKDGNIFKFEFPKGTKVVKE